jgi:ferric-dicitrate binding protein FerR (iron transport regulator)
MPKYRATVHLTGMTGENPRAVRSALDEQLRKGGFENCQIVSVDLEAPKPKPKLPVRSTAKPPNEPAWRRQANAGGLLLVAAAAWAIWFFWWMLSTSSE